nr:unnamed protein product [Digitaria exilis]
MKRKFSPPPLVADGRKRKKSGRRGGDIIDDLPLLLTDKPVPHLLVTEVIYTPLSRNHNPSNSKFPCVAFNRRGSIVSLPLDGSVVVSNNKPHPASTAAINPRGRLADLYRRCLSFIGATSHGHLAFAGSNAVFLVNPVTDTLQCIDTVGYSHKAVLANGGRHGCNLFVSLGALLSPPTLWRLDKDGDRWSKYTVTVTAGEHTGGDVVSAVNCGNNGCFYLLHEDGCVSKVDAVEPPPLRMEKLPVASLAGHFSPAFNKTASLAGEGHLVESSHGEVLFVRKLLAVREIVEPFCAHTEFADVVDFEVYRLDVTKLRWEKVERLAGGEAIFVSPESAFTVTETAAAGCKGNCVYFVGEKRCCFACRVYGGSTWGAYSMDDRRVLFEHAVASKGGRSEALWFLPSVV